MADRLGLSAGWCVDLHVTSYSEKVRGHAYDVLKVIWTQLFLSDLGVSAESMMHLNEDIQKE